MRVPRGLMGRCCHSGGACDEPSHPEAPCSICARGFGAVVPAPQPSGHFNGMLAAVLLAKAQQRHLASAVGSGASASASAIHSALSSLCAETMPMRCFWGDWRVSGSAGDVAAALQVERKCQRAQQAALAGVKPDASEDGATEKLTCTAAREAEKLARPRAPPGPVPAEPLQSALGNTHSRTLAPARIRPFEAGALTLRSALDCRIRSRCSRACHLVARSRACAQQMRGWGRCGVADGVCLWPLCPPESLNSKPCRDASP